MNENTLNYRRFSIPETFEVTNIKPLVNQSEERVNVVASLEPIFG